MPQNLKRSNIFYLGLGFLAGTFGGLVALPRILGKREKPLPQFNDKAGTALITGASSGIGAAFAHHLARLGYDLVLVARRKERLDELADLLRSRYLVQVEVLAADLAVTEAVAQVEQRLREIDTLTLLVNNAGFGAYRYFTEIELQTQVDMINVNVMAGVRLAYAALPGMLNRGQGAIINVASVAGVTPAKRNVIYSATKSFVINFSEALSAELQGTGVRVQALCPGFTRTEFHSSDEFAEFDKIEIPEQMWMTPEAVVEESLAALKQDQVVFAPGQQYRLAMSLLRIPGLRGVMLDAFNRQA